MAQGIVSPEWLARETAEIDRRANVPGLQEFIPLVTPKWESPRHLKPYTDILEAFPGGGLRVVVSAPPQHAKSESAMHAFPWWLIQYPQLRFIYITYGQDKADRVEIRANFVAQRAGMVFKKRKNVWSTPQGGGVIWTSLTGQITGEPVDGGVLIDDPYKDMRDAESSRTRQIIQDAMDMVIDTRLHRGASVVVMATRWHAQDLSGWLVKTGGYHAVNLKAIADGDQPPGDNRKPGEALWPRRKSRDELEELRRKKPFMFASMYQGEPRPREGKLFGDPSYFDRMPDVPYRLGYGLDLSYTKKTSADWSVLIRMRQVGDVFYVVGLWRRQVRAPDFATTIKMQQKTYPGVAYFYCAGPEVGSSDFMRRDGVRVLDMPARTDKYARAQDTADAWNSSRILLPSPGSEFYGDWVHELAIEVQDFSGVDGATDDQVDALVSGHDGLMRFGSGDYDPTFDAYLPEFRT